MHKSAALSVVTALVLGFGGLLVNCGDNDKGNPVGGGNSQQTMTMTGTYRTTADSLYVTITMPPDTYSYCMADSLYTSIDTGMTLDESGIPFSLSGNTLTLSASESSLTSVPYVIEETSILSRAGSGTGIQGIWVLTSTSYSVVSGTLPDSTRHRLDSTVTQTNAAIASGTEAFRLIFSGDQMTEEITYSFSWAGYYVESWTTCDPIGYSLDTCTYAVIVTKLNDNAVQISGTASNEIVTITWDADGNQTYTSTNASHPAHTYYLHPTSCPNDASPAWFITFLTANSKILPVSLTKHASLPLNRQKAARIMIKKFLLR